MRSLEDRQSLVADVEQSQRAGARLDQACRLLGLDLRTLQRWKSQEGLVQGDRRPGAVRGPPSHAPGPDERAEILRIANEPRFAEIPPARIVPMLADEGRYVASESSFSRILRAEGQNRHRGRTKAPQPRREPSTYIATAPGQVWCWDMTYLPTEVAGRWLHLYLIMDLYSRKIIGWEVHDRDAAEHAAQLAKRTALWAKAFVHWYNVEHRHSGIRYVSPEQRHSGQDVAILEARDALYRQARAAHPARWSAATRTRIETVALNPEKEVLCEATANKRKAA